MTHTLGAAGERLIKGYEKEVLMPYRDSKGVLTDGYGHTEAAGGHIPVVGVAITHEEAEANFRHDVSKFSAIVNRLVTVPLNQNQFDALVSFELNTGGLHGSTLLRKLNSGDYKSVPSELLKWDRCKIHGVSTVLPGLDHRRHAEVVLWCSRDPLENPTDGAAEIDVVPPKRRSMVRSKIGNSAVISGVATAGVAINDTLSSVSSTTDNITSVVTNAGTAAGAAAALPDQIQAGVTGFLTSFALHPQSIILIGASVLLAAIWFWRYEAQKDETV